MSRTRDPEHDDTPTLIELVKTPLDRQIVEFQLERVELGRPVVGPPGVPADRVAALRTAFDKAVVDPEFLKEAALLKLAIDPINGAGSEQVINRLYRTPAPVLDRIRKVVQAAPE